MATDSHAFYVSKNNRLTDSQCLSIGRVATAWSIVEHGLEGAIARLSFAPDYTSLAVTNDLGLDNRLKCLLSLIKLHEGRYYFGFANPETLDRLKAIIKEISAIKKQRNMAVHYVWFRQSDSEMFGIRFKAINPPDPKKPTESMWETTSEKIMLLAEKIDKISHDLWVLVGILPPVPEPSRQKPLRRVPPPSRKQGQKR